MANDRIGSFEGRPGTRYAPPYTPLERRRPLLTRLKRLLRPAKPVLQPIWRGVRPYVQRQPHPHIRRPLTVRLRIVKDRSIRVTRRRRPPIRPLRKSEFDEIARRFPYYNGRWKYMAIACALAGDLIDTYRAQTALELGPHLQPVVVGADVMDMAVNPELSTTGRVLIHNATQAPWPVADKHYDLFVALQVFEHLGSSQREAFREVCRVARHAIISLPIDWVMADPKNSHHQISNEMALSWFLPVVPTRVELGNDGRRKRLIYVFENLPAT